MFVCGLKLERKGLFRVFANVYFGFYENVTKLRRFAIFLRGVRGGGRLENGDGRWKTGYRRQEKGDRIRETRDGRQEI